MLVIWGLGLIALLLLASIAAARWRVSAVANAAGAAEAKNLAEAAALIAGSRLASGEPGPAGVPAVFDGRPVTCALPGGALAAIAIEDEGGKVDLNGAPPKLLEALFTGFGVEAGVSADIARAIIGFRTAGPLHATAGGASGIGPKHALFQTIFELDQVAGTPPGLAAELAPFITVSPARAGLDPALAPPALFAALSGASIGDVRALAAQPYPSRLDRTDPRFPLAFIQGSPGGVYLIHAEAITRAGAVAVRELLVDVRQPGQGGLSLRERRTGRSRFGGSLGELLKSGRPNLPGC